jgi:hypothetical protein
MRLKDKADEGKNRMQEYQNIEMELYKRNEEILTLKTTIELALR